MIGCGRSADRARRHRRLRRQLRHHAGGGDPRARVLPSRVRGRRDRAEPLSDRAVARRAATWRCRRSCRACSATRRSISAPTAASMVRPTSGASASACPNTRCRRPCGCAASSRTSSPSRRRTSTGCRAASRPRPARQVPAQPAGRLSAHLGAERRDPLGHARRRRARCGDLGPPAVLLHRRPSQGAAAVSRLPRRRARLLSALRGVSDHACGRHPARRARAASLACRQRLQGVRRGEADRRCGSGGDHRAEDRPALGDGRARRHREIDGRRISGPTASRPTARS